MRVLLIEDNAPTSRAMQQLLELEGFDVDAARTVADGRLRLSDGSIDWLLLDLMLPDGPGELLLEELRDRGLSTRVAVLTGVLDPDRLKRVADFQPEVIMEKPYDPDRLLRMLLGSQRSDA